MKKVLCALVCIFIVNFIQAQVTVVINEIMAQNSITIQDNTGDYDDYIELYNYGTSTVDIGGFYITDSLPNPVQYQIPTGNDSTKLSPGEFLLIWADNKPSEGVLHVGFKLSVAGEQVGLYKPDQTLVNSLTFGAQTTDVAYGRLTDNSATWGFLPNPSPGYSNNPQYVILSTNAITLSSAAGSNATFTVTSNSSWNAVSNQGWLTVAPGSGTNNQTITITATANTSSSSRAATVTVQGTGITSQMVFVTQIGNTPAVILSDNSLIIDYHANSSGSINVLANVAWSTSCPETWLQISPPTGTNSGTITFTVPTQNPTGADRIATVTVSGTGVSSQIVYVNQIGTPVLPTIVINEILPFNDTLITDNHNEYEDWVEIYNYGSSPVDIGGLYFTDNLVFPEKYQLPSGNDSTIIPAHGFKVLWCDQQPEQGVLHLDFKLSDIGEQVGVYLSYLYVIDSKTYPAEPANISYGRYPDGGNTWHSFNVPTPGAPNYLSVPENVLPELKIYPNPVSGFMNIDMQLKGYFQLEIIDFSGQCIKYGTYAGPLSLDLSNISDGIYLVRIMFGTNVYSRKIVKMK
jgi:hypothetical protein